MEPSNISTRPFWEHTFKSANIVIHAFFTLPAASALGILAGSSMGPIIPPDNVASHIPGTSVDDSLGEVFGHTGEQLIDLGASAADAIGQGISNAADGIAGLVDHILDSLG